MTDTLNNSDRDPVEKILSQLVEGCSNASIYSQGNKIVTCNTLFVEMLGCQNKDEVVGSDLVDLFSSDDKEKIWNYVTSSQKAKFSSELGEFHIKKRDGTILKIEGSFSLIQNDDDPIFLMFLRDNIEHQADKKIKLLHKHAIQLNEVNSTDKIGKITLDIMQKTLGYTYISFQIVMDDQLVIVDSIGGAFVSNPLPIKGRGITTKAARESRSILVDDIRKEPSYIDGFSETLSELAVPIISEDNVFGVLNIESDKLNAFSENDRVVMEILAMHVGSALSRMEHIENLSKIHEKHSQEIVENFQSISSMVQHDLRSPLTSIKLLVELLRKNPEKMNEYTEIIDKNLTYSENILSDLNQFIYTWKISPEPVYIRELVNAAIETIIIPPSIEVVVDIDSSLSHKIDSKSIQRVLYNLILNSIDAITEKGRITVGARKNNETLEITVSDTGRGINEDIQSRLFTPFTTDKPDGIGLGLAYCKQAVESHNGAINFKTNISHGSIFTVNIPRLDSAPSD